jgi:chemotaxis protein methyltransferase CheR
VLIYFKRPLQNRALGLFTESLVPGGFLCLGTKEDLEFTAARDAFEEVDRKARIFKRRSGP